MKLSNEIKKGIACDSVGTPDSAIGRALCIGLHPGKMALFPFLHWFRYHYQNKYKFARLMFSLDLILIGIVIALAGVAAWATFLRPPSFEDQIVFQSTIAPREVTTGQSATMSIHFRNTSKEELRDVRFDVQYPRYFALEEVRGIDPIDTIPAGASGTIHIRGVMFGDVGGAQNFETHMRFVHGEDRDTPVEKIDRQTFSPTRSALVLSLELPDRLAAFQPIEGVVRYTNTSTIDFPIVSLQPQWPDAFTLTGTDARVRAGQFEIPAVRAGAVGEFRFTGVIDEPVEDVTFTFAPSFTFDDERFAQSVLTHTAPVVPLPLSLTHGIAQTALHPGTSIPVQVRYENTGEEIVHDVRLSIESPSPFFLRSDTQTIDAVQPGERVETELSLTLRPYILQTQTDVYENLSVQTRAVAAYVLGDGSGQPVLSKSPALALALVTPVRLDAFARYRTQSGDQIGRGPMPPEPGRETTFWVFLNISGTTSALEHVRVQAELPAGVRYTGRQSISQNGEITYDDASRTITWSSDRLDPTFAPTSRVAGAAFELGVTPETSADATRLLEHIVLTATDQHTGTPLTRSVPDVGW